MMPTLDIRDLHVQLGARRVLSDVSLQIRAGTLCALVGPNGSGKSTLLRAVCGLIVPQDGTILWNDSPLPASRVERARLVAWLPQSPGGGDDLSVEEMAMLGRTPHLSPYGAPSKLDREIVEHVVASVAPDLRGRRLGELSGGQRQRALLCRALATRAPVLLLDEPVAALDIRFQHEILDLVRRLTRELNLATICVLHGLNLAARSADSMLLLGCEGRVEASGSPDEVMTREHLERVYQVPMRVAPHPLGARPQTQSFYEFAADEAT